jgi:uncharacterized membrane-anchored protein YhcB (DUF1043 family)
MATEPTIGDVLEMLARMRDETKAELGAVRAEVAAHRAETATGFAETKRALADLDDELAKHSAPVHGDLERRVTALEAASKTTPKRPAPARPRRRT